MKTLVIIGTGLGGYSLAREVRKLDPDLALVLISADDGRYYSKPLLSNAYTTNAPDVYALGDCAEVEGLVLPFVMPIMHAARALAKTLCGEPTRLTYPAMPIVVKTTTYPVVVAPPAADIDGSWQVDDLGSGLRALFHRPDKSLAGFALTGTAVSEKNSLAKEFPPMLGEIP